jgi:hypothetical protein
VVQKLLHAALEALARLDRATAHRLGEQHLGRLRELNADRPRVADKMPDNYLYLGLLAALFPKAKYIHCRRDLRDVAVSSWMTNFRQIRWANDPDHIVGRFQEYRRIMEHWRRVLPLPVFEIDYEETVADLEGWRGGWWTRAAWTGSRPAWRFTRANGRCGQPASARSASPSTSARLPAGRTTSRICAPSSTGSAPLILAAFALCKLARAKGVGGGPFGSA